MARVASYAREIVPSFNAYAYFRIGYSLARNIARFLYRVRLGYSDEEGLAAIPPKSTVVFLMNHRSNMDYILVGYLAAEKAAISYAVGEWARIWPLQQLVRSMGAYFVRRNSHDALYRKVLERWVAMATEAGVTQAVFPEGGSFTGRPIETAEGGDPRLHGARLRSGRRARHRLRAGRHQLRPHVRRPHARKRARPGGETRQRAGRAASDARLRREEPRADGGQPMAPVRLRVRRLRLADLAQGLDADARGRFPPARPGRTIRARLPARRRAHGRGRRRHPRRSRAPSSPARSSASRSARGASSS